MTDISVYSSPLQAEDLSWDLTPPHGGFDQNGTLAVASFTQAQHFSKGYIPSGTVLALATGGTYAGSLVPYLSGGSNGQGTPVGVLKASLTVVRPNGSTLAKVGAAYRVHGAVSQSRLPFTSGNAAAGGFLDAAAITALKLIYFAA